MLRMGSNPAFSRSGAKDRFLRLVGLTSVPLCVAKMRPSSWFPETTLSPSTPLTSREPSAQTSTVSRSI